MVEIRNRKELRAWLDNRPQAWAGAIAWRAAARVLPLARPRDGRNDLTRGVVRALFISWAAGNWPAQEMRLASASAADAARAARAARAYKAVDAAAATDAARAAAATAATDAADAATHAADAADAADAATHAYKAVDADVNWLDAQLDRRASAAALLAQPLWPMGVNEPFILDSRRERFRSELSGANEDWSIWLEWYDRRHKGATEGWDRIDPQKHEQLCVSIALESDNFWDRPAGEVNRDVTERVEAARLPPPQDTAVEHFQTNEQNRIARGPLTESDQLQDEPSHRDHYLEFRKSFSALAACSENELGEALRNQVNDLADILTDSLADLNRHLFWPRFDRLRKTLRRHDRATASNDYSPHKLDGDVADDVREVVSNGRILIANQPKLIDTEEQAAGTFRDAIPKDIIDAALPAIEANASDPEVTTSQVGEDVTVAVEASNEETADISDQMAASNGRRVIRNYLIALVERARKLPGYLGKKVGEAALTESAKAGLKKLWEYREAILAIFGRSSRELATWAARALDDIGNFLASLL